MTQGNSEVPNVLIANGVNLDLLGKREPEIYGTQTIDEINQSLASKASILAQMGGFQGVNLSFFQTNNEHLFLEELSKEWDGAIVNAGAWTHTSIAIADRLRGLGLPFVEVHLSNLSLREDFRKISYTAPHAQGVVYGMGVHSYISALLGLLCQLS